MERPEKIEAVGALKKAFGSSVVALCADYRGTAVKEMTELRSGLKQEGAYGQVVKNTLAKISIHEAYSEGEQDEVQKFAALFEGPSFVVFSEEDPVSPAKVLAKFAKANPALEIKGGFFEGKFLDLNEVKNLSSMPSKDELYAQLLSVIAAPATKVVQLLSAPALQTVRVVDAVRAKKEESA